MNKMRVGLQLYSIQDAMARDLEAALKSVKEMGYDYVEFDESFGKTPQEFKELLDKYDLECISAHMDYAAFLEESDENIMFLKTIGAKYCAIPWIGVEKHKGHEQYEKTVEDIIRAAKRLKENGIQMLYHNHDFEFEKYEDKYLLDWLYDTIPAELLQPQVDTCWVRYAGVDPSDYLKKYTGRIKVVHLKDFVCKEFAKGPVYELQGISIYPGDKQKANGFEFRPIGQGCQDFPAILKAAQDAGAEYVIVEQDLSTTVSSLESARQSRNYLMALGI